MGVVHDLASAEAPSVREKRPFISMSKNSHDDQWYSHTSVFGTLRIQTQTS